jgi:hypothetical protein
VTAPVTARPLVGRVVAALLGVLAMAPTVGDTGACGRTATDLDRDRYANARKLEDCQRCQECGLTTARCQSACDPAQLPAIVLPATCRPLFHDGEVCLRALDAASCSTYATYVDDDAPAVPTECDFCQTAPPAPAPPSVFAEAGVIGDGGASSEGGAP